LPVVDDTLRGMSNANRLPDPVAQRHFAEVVVRQLREAGFQALWAGGCVRDMLLGQQPVDYDVATDAEPEQIRVLFGRRRTIAVGAAFGVITVLGPRDAGQIEVATFRRDLGYTDGRHPDAVAFSSAEEDARRRDFTINGLFFDPVEQRVIDYVDGQADIRRRVIRAIGSPRERFSEDKLRMLRAVRFAARLGFALEADTQAAIAAMAAGLDAVSPERIGQEMRKLLVAPHRVTGVRMLIETRLAEQVLPEILPSKQQSGLPAASRQCPGAGFLVEALTVLERLGQSPSFPLALAAVLLPFGHEADVIARLTSRWRLTNDESDRVRWLLVNVGIIREARGRAFSALQPLLIHPGVGELITLADARWPGSEDVEFFRTQSQRPRAELDPPPLLTGTDLIANGMTPSPAFGRWLGEVRRAQLDGEIHSRDEALAMIDQMNR